MSEQATTGEALALIERVLVECPECPEFKAVGGIPREIPAGAGGRHGGH